MIDKIEYLTDGDKKYPMAFTLNVMEKAEEEYGGVSKWVTNVWYGNATANLKKGINAKHWT